MNEKLPCLCSAEFKNAGKKTANEYCGLYHTLLLFIIDHIIILIICTKQCQTRPGHFRAAEDKKVD